MEAGLKENTVVIFLTDNGSTFGPEYFNAGMKGKKTTLWEGGHRVPCLIRWPKGALGVPREVDELSHVQDRLPTLADLAEVNTLSNSFDGKSLAPVFRGDRKTLDDRMLVINYSRMPQFNVTYTDENPAIPARDGAAVLWKNWRLLENRELYDVDKDLYQENDVADQYPQVVAQMRRHLETWWEAVREEVLEVQRVIIGSDHENPTFLTACEWLDVFVDQQVQVRRAVLKNGVWHLRVARSGTYEFELCRWPKVSNQLLRDSLPVEKATDGQFPSGTGLSIQQAKIRIGDFQQTAVVTAEDASVTFKTDLKPGNTELQTWFLDEQSEEFVVPTTCT